MVTIKFSKIGKQVFLFILLIILFAFGIYASISNPGHYINKLAPPVGCGNNEFVQWNGSSWGCINLDVENPWIASSNGIYYDAGNVGVGTSYAPAKLSVNGKVLSNSGSFFNGIIRCKQGITFNSDSFICHVPKIGVFTRGGGNGYALNHMYELEAEGVSEYVVCSSLGGHFVSKTNDPGDVQYSAHLTYSSPMPPQWVIGDSTDILGTVTCDYNY